LLSKQVTYFWQVDLSLGFIVTQLGQLAGMAARQLATASVGASLSGPPAVNVLPQPTANMGRR